MDSQQAAVQRPPGSFFEDAEHYTFPYVVIIPMHREMTALTAFSLEKATLAGLPFGWMPHAGDALIGRARSIAATWFLEYSPASYLIFIDSDMVFEPMDMARLMKDLRDGYELIGGTYVVRSGKFLAHWGDNGKVILGGETPIRPIRFLSTGFMGISKTLLRRMVDQLEMPICHPSLPIFRCYPFFESGAKWFEDNKEWIFMSEDWDFCEKARKVGTVPYLDSSILVGHAGDKVWTTDDLPKETITPLNTSLGNLNNSQAEGEGEK